MKLHKNIIRVALAGVVLAATSATIIAQTNTDNGAGPFKRGQMLLRILELGLTPAQVGDIREAVSRHRETITHDLKRLATEQRNLRAVIRKSPTDEKAVRDAVAKRAAIEAELALTRGRITADVQKILTPEQTAKVDGLYELIDAKVDEAIERVSVGLKTL
jgi:Spy/CpxP family protein refolding chaperone